MNLKHFLAPMLIAVVVAPLVACQSHPTLRYSPEEYSRLRKVEVLTTAPTRNYRVISVVTGMGGRHTAKETMMNAMIDEAHKLGADALIPLEFPASPPKHPVDAFVHTENGHTVTRGNAIKWEADPRWQP